MLSKEIKEDLYIEMEPIYREAGHRYAKNEIEKRIEVFAMALSLSNDAEETLEQQIIEREEREKLLKQIDALEKRCRLEKQTRKKYELYQQLLKLKEELKYE